MNNIKHESVFNRSGLAALSDLQTEQYRKTFSFLEEEQSEFLRKAGEFRSQEYKWPNAPLHCWSRIWEYPYVYYHLAHHLESLAKDSQLTVADVGSGVTFFPFSLAKLGYKVICTDIDLTCKKDISLARERVSHSSGNVHFRSINNAKLPFEDGECDALYCISVLEHIPDFENTVIEMARVLKLGGLCLITCDLDLTHVVNAQLNVAQYEQLVSIVGKHFSLVWPERTIHPLDMLTSRNSPYSDRWGNYLEIGYRLIKQKILKPLLGRKPGYVSILGPAPLAVLGLILQKRR